MNINTYFCGACTTCGIADLGSHTDATDAMKAFCTSELGAPQGSRFSKEPLRFSKLTAFYVFTAGPEIKGHGHSKAWVKYATEFAQFIRDNELGEIATLPARKNAKYHPNTTCQTWLWAPDQKAMEDWWTKMQKKGA